MSNLSIQFRRLIDNRLNEKKIISMLENAGTKVQEDIKSLAPVDTGAYRDSIQLSSVEKNNDIYSITIFSDLNSGWHNIALGYLLEWGTGIKGESTNAYDHVFPYRQTPWTYYNERYGKWIFTYGNIARPHFFPGLHLNDNYFKELVIKEIVKK